MRASAPSRHFEEPLEALVLERQELRVSAATRAELERNRRAIVDCQWELTAALIERHGQGQAA